MLHFSINLHDCFTFILSLFFSFFFNATATTEIYTLSLHDALPILRVGADEPAELLDRLLVVAAVARELRLDEAGEELDRKSTRLNSSHVEISYAVFCLKKKKKISLTRKIEIYRNKLN